jgi:glutathione S-transferase
MKQFLKLGEPHGPSVRAGHANIHYHLDYVAYLIERRRWLAGDSISYADLAAAAHLSCIDYMGDVPWDEHPVAKSWYMRVKSRPSFKPLLDDHVPGFMPASHYTNIDF